MNDSYPPEFITKIQRSLDREASGEFRPDPRYLLMVARILRHGGDVALAVRCEEVALRLFRTSAGDLG